MHPLVRGGHKSETYRRRSGRRQWLREFAGCTCTCRGCILHRATSRPRPTCRLDHSRGPTNSRPGPATHGSPSGRTKTSQLHIDRQQSDSSVADDTVPNNNNNNNHDNVHGALIMTKVIARVYPVHLMNVDWAPGDRQPSDQASRLGCESAENRQLPSCETRPWVKPLSNCKPLTQQNVIQQREQEEERRGLFYRAAFAMRRGENNSVCGGRLRRAGCRLDRCLGSEK